MKSLKEQVEATLASWINHDGIDAFMNRADYKVAEDAMNYRPTDIVDGELSRLPSINELLSAQSAEEIKHGEDTEAQGKEQ